MVIDSIANKPLIDQLIGDFKPDAIAHTAASYKDPDDWYNDTLTRIPNAQVEVVVTRTGVTRHFRVDVLIKWTRKAGAYENKYTVNSHIAASQ